MSESGSGAPIAVRVFSDNLDTLATLIYTSGTTGPPKGVMLTHRNVAWTVESLRRSLDLESYLGKRVVSYLPMAHIAERMTSHYQQAWLGYEVTSCPDPGQIGAYARDVRPNVMFGVPRVWEKIHAGVVGALAADPDRSRWNQRSVTAADLARAYGCTDLDGSQPDGWK